MRYRKLQICLKEKDKVFSNTQTAFEV
ncbi:hypothetical protein OYC64_009447 [Pagothenia borchgrevinki]|uniref:Uncharacterized protein n=1 Tax=Pagothenia borchgrevinki TaxID=8213 RepID=A0ABD2H5L5_PAGBO